MTNTDQEKLELARRAIEHVLSRIRTDETVAYHLGYGSESFALLTQAMSTIAGEDLVRIRDYYANAEAFVNRRGDAAGS